LFSLSLFFSINNYKNCKHIDNNLNLYLCLNVSIVKYYSRISIFILWYNIFIYYSQCFPLPKLTTDKYRVTMSRIIDCDDSNLNALVCLRYAHCVIISYIKLIIISISEILKVTRLSTIFFLLFAINLLFLIFVSLK